MFNTLKKRIKNEKGLSLVELLAVIVILGIVAAIAIPAIGNIIENSRTKAAKADVANIVSAANIYFTENPSVGTFSNATTGVGDYIAEKGSVLTFTVTKGDATTSATVVATGSLNNKGYTVTSTTVQGLKVSEKDVADDNFDWDSN